MKKVTFNESQMYFEDIQELRKRYSQYLGFRSFQRVEEYYRGDKLVAVTIAASEARHPHTIVTSRGEFYRIYANQMLPLEIVGVDNEYMHIVVHNNFLKQKRLHLKPFAI